MRHQVLHVYYLDEPLSDEERQFIERTLLGHWADFKTGATGLEQRRIPMVLPIDGDFASRIQTARGNLRRAGIGDDSGRQVAWIGTRDLSWTPIFMMAIAEETGFQPYFLKRWWPDSSSDEMTRGELQIIDAQGLMSG